MSLLLAAGAAAVAVLAGVRPSRVPPRPVAPPPSVSAPERRARRGWSGVVGARRVAPVLAAGAALVVDPFLAPVVAVAVWSAPRAVALVVERRRRAAIGRAVPVGIELLVLAIHAGLTPRQAIAVMVELAPPPLRPAFVEAATRLERGHPLAEAVDALTRRIGPEWGPVADQLAVAEREGAPLAPVLARLGDEARRHRRFRAEADARRLPVRLAVPLVVCILPAFALVAIAPAVLAALSSLGDPAW
jgi:tight adherence protein C